MRGAEEGARRAWLTNVELMVPFVRTLGEAKQVMDLLERMA